MPHIVNPSRFKTKKAFKLAIDAGEHVFCDDPSIFAGSFSGTPEEILATRDYFTVTNHPQRSWFAGLKRNSKGKIVVV